MPPSEPPSLLRLLQPLLGLTAPAKRLNRKASAPATAATPSTLNTIQAITPVTPPAISYPKKRPNFARKFAPETNASRITNGKALNQLSSL